MTFWAQRAENSGNIDVHVTHGPVSIHVVEHYGHLKHFWGQLGALIEETEKSIRGSVPPPGDV